MGSEMCIRDRSQAEGFLLFITLCGALALDYVNATGENWVCMYTSINIVSRPVSF